MAVEYSQEQLDSHFKELTKYEVQFLNENDGQKNEHGAYCYQSQNGNHLIALEMFLASYKQWLLNNNIVQLID
jgi:hypothetical protein